MKLCGDKHYQREGKAYAPGIGVTNDLHVKVLKDGLTVELLAPFVARSNGHRIEAPRGMKTDFASVPRFFWRVLPPWGRYSPAAVIHDYLYQSGRLPKDEADLIFLDLMTRLGVPRWKRTVMYWALRLFGFAAWNNYRRKH